jgi:7-carboxy-7-deazaguanine synthase
MTYNVKELFFTLQGEGAQAGRPAVFCRFSSCNLWTGREGDRSRAICRFCDTDFVGTDGAGGGRFASSEQLAEAISRQWSDLSAGAPFVVFTGGEPTLQLDRELVDAVHGRGFMAAVETNGTRPVALGCDWICVSPKAGAPVVQRHGDELKLVFPQRGLPPSSVESLDFRYFYLQPMDGPGLEAHTSAAVAYCLEHPKWRLSLQTHKLLGIP